MRVKNNKSKSATLREMANDFMLEVLRTTAKIDGVPFHGAFKACKLQDREAPRILNLKVWCLRYDVSLEQVLRILFSYFENVRHPSTNKTVTLGISVKALCGNRSREILEEKLSRDNVSSENLLAKACEIKRQKAFTSATINQTGNLFEATRAYIQATEKRRRRFSKYSYFSRRPWRNNPWR